MTSPATSSRPLRTSAAPPRRPRRGSGMLRQIRPPVVRCTVHHRTRRRRRGRPPHRADRRHHRRPARPRRQLRRGLRHHRRHRRRARSMRARRARRSRRFRLTRASRRRRQRRMPVGRRRRGVLTSRRGGAAARSSLTSRPRSSRPRIWLRPAIRRSAMGVPATSSPTCPSARPSTRVGRRRRRRGRLPVPSSRCSVAPSAVVNRSPVLPPTAAPLRNPRKSSPRIVACRSRDGARRCRR